MGIHNRFLNSAFHQNEKDPTDQGDQQQACNLEGRPWAFVGKRKSQDHTGGGNGQQEGADIIDFMGQALGSAWYADDHEYHAQYGYRDGSPEEVAPA